MKVDNIKFKNLDIYYHNGKVPRNIILDVENMFNIKLPDLYVGLIEKYNAPKINQNYFDYYDLYTNENGFSSFKFDGFHTETYNPKENILAQYIYNDEIYGYKNVYSFGSTAEGNWVCFDYREDPSGNNPKICIVIHDEYDEKTGKRLLFPVANNFDEFLDNLYDFDERYPDGWFY